MAWPHGSHCPSERSHSLEAPRGQEDAQACGGALARAASTGPAASPPKVTQHLPQPPRSISRKAAFPGEVPSGPLKKAQEPSSVKSGFIEKQQHRGPRRRRGHSTPHPSCCSHAHRRPGTPPQPAPGPAACLLCNLAGCPSGPSQGRFWRILGSQGSCHGRGPINSKPQEVQPATTKWSGLCAPKDTVSTAVVVKQPGQGDAMLSALITARLAECPPCHSPRTPRDAGKGSSWVAPASHRPIQCHPPGGKGTLHSRSAGPWGRPRGRERAQRRAVDAATCQDPAARHRAWGQPVQAGTGGPRLPGSLPGTTPLHMCAHTCTSTHRHRHARAHMVSTRVHTHRHTYTCAHAHHTHTQPHRHTHQTHSVFKMANYCC